MSEIGTAEPINIEVRFLFFVVRQKRKEKRGKEKKEANMWKSVLIAILLLDVVYGGMCFLFFYFIVFLVYFLLFPFVFFKNMKYYITFYSLN